jgi:para-aminobenzoate synthetase component 1
MRLEPTALFRDDFSGSIALFAEPREILVAHSATELDALFEELEQARAAGLWSAGFLSYEAGYFLDPALLPIAETASDVPLACFGIFGGPQDENHPLARPVMRSGKEPFFSNPRAGWDFEAYQSRFSELHGHLRRGNCYQANLTFPIRAGWKGDPLSLFWSLIERQPVKYGAYINLAGPVLVSRSPELFFKIGRDNWIETHPMKGTAPRRPDAAADAAEIENLKNSEKTQAENRMIVDLLRNDISRVTEVGTLDVPSLFEIETYPTLHQMISRVRARLRPDVTIRNIFDALFPCGSVTGAPKISAMTILHELETGPRGAYCGAIGYIAPNGEARFNVAIRTVSLFEGGEAVFNVGGGIVFDSEAQSEYDEALLKARFAVGDEWISR